MHLWQANTPPNGMPKFDATPPGYAFATIGPSSLIHEVEINGSRLGPGGIVRLADGPNKVVGVRPLLADSVGTVLELALWTEDETPTPAKRASAIVKYSKTIDTDAAYVQILQAAWSGRERGVMRLRAGTDGQSFEWAVKMRTAYAGGEFFAEYDAGTFTTTADPETAKLTSLVLNIGGHGDMGELVDQVEVYYRRNGDTSVVAELEAVDS